MASSLGTLLFFHVVLPFLLVGSLAVLKARSRFVWISHVLLIVSYLFFVSRTGAGWHVLFDDLPWVWWVGFLIASLFSSYRMGGAPLRPATPVGWALGGAFLLGAAGVGYLLLTDVLPAREYEGEPVALGFPLGPGEFYVVEGGSLATVNAHADTPAQRYAIDFVALNDIGARAEGLSPTANTDYSIYGAPVRSPCKGRALVVVDGLDGNTPPATDEQHVAGNYLVLHCEEADVTVLLSQLEKNSLVPKQGKRVRLGEEIAAVGNSGKSTEPHLHMHVVRGKVEDDNALMQTGESVPVTFSERFLIRNDKIVVR